MTTRVNPGQSRSELPADGGRTDARLGQLVRLLVDNAMVVVSGTKLADELQTNRSDVWRLIEQLRELGVDITGHSATGYQLLSVPDLLLPGVIAPLVQGTVFASDIRHYFRVGSTNIEAMQAAAAGAPDGSVFLAEEQTAGRGRGGHTWDSAPSTGIYCSVVLRPALSPADVLVISLAAGLAVANAVENVTGLKPDLRWPNDLLVGERKVCGILTELNAEVTRVRYVVVGVGMNVNQHAFPPDLESLATSLSLETGRIHSRVELTAALLKSLDREYRALRTNVSAARKDILRRFEMHSSYVRGKQVWVEEDGGYEGTTAGLDDRGFLQVQTASGMRTVLSGGVRPRQA